MKDVKLSSNVTVAALERMISKQQQDEISKFLSERFTERYFTPIDKLENHEKHGFSIMAISCLLIETLESFYNGWETTDKKSGQAFRQFFYREKLFVEFTLHTDSFYKNIRCGILHQAETTGGWRIIRTGNLLDVANKSINATKFFDNLKESLKDYCEKVKTEKWDSELSDNLRRKLRTIIKNCT